MTTRQSSKEGRILKSRTKQSYEVRLPLIRSKNPGTLPLTNAEIEEIIARDEARQARLRRPRG